MLTTARQPPIHLYTVKLMARVPGILKEFQERYFRRAPLKYTYIRYVSFKM